MTWAIANEEERKFFAELSSLPDRTVGLLAPAIVDDRLATAIQSMWHTRKHSGNDLLRGLFRDGGQLGNYGTRIDIGFAIGLYGEATHTDLHTMRRIRNRFAHRISAREFDSVEITGLVNTLALPDRFPIRPEDVNRVIPLDNPTVLEWGKFLFSYSYLPDINTPRNRFLRTAEILTIMFTFDGNPRRFVRRVPDFP